MDSATLDLRIKVYQWAKHELPQEIQSGFSRLAITPSIMARAQIRAFQDLRARERKVVVPAWLKHNHPEAAAAKGEALSIDESKLVMAFTVEMMSRRADVEGELLGTDKRSRRKVRVKGLRQLLREQLRDTVGPVDPTDDSRSEWTHTRLLESWEVRTHFDLGGTDQVRLSHTIRYRQSEKIYSSVCGWLGLQADSFDLLGAEDAPRAVELLAQRCDEFINLIRKLVLV